MEKNKTCNTCKHHRPDDPIPCGYYSVSCVNSKDKPNWEAKKGFRFTVLSHNIVYEVRSIVLEDAIAEVAVLLEKESVELVYEGVFTELGLG